MAKAKNKVFNFQRGSSGNSSKSKTFTFKERTDKGTRAYQVRCDGKSKEVCRKAQDLLRKAHETLMQFPDDADPIGKEAQKLDAAAARRKAKAKSK